MELRIQSESKSSMMPLKHWNFSQMTVLPRRIIAEMQFLHIISGHDPGLFLFQQSKVQLDKILKEGEIKEVGNYADVSILSHS